MESLMMMKNKLKTMALLVLGIVVISGMNGCEKTSKTAVSEVHWDRDMCTRCVMVVSDRKNTVELKNPNNGKTYMFDDIGCMALWLDEEHIPWRDKAVVWITDVDTGEWIDAKKAFYDTNNVTPMSYGYSAHKTKESIQPNEEILSYDEVLKRVTHPSK